MKSKLLATCLLLLLCSLPSHAMHIMEGYLPLGWCIFWAVASLPFVVLSYRHVRRLIAEDAKGRVHFALNTAFVFILSALKLPSVTGSSSHLTGTTLGTLTTGVMSMPLVGFVVLLFQALLLAHGGVSTLGANIFSLAIAGPLVAYSVYLGLKRLGSGASLAIFAAAMFGSLATYITTSLQLAVVYPDSVGGVWASFLKFCSIFALTQVPLSIVEGIMTVLVMRLVGLGLRYQSPKAVGGIKLLGLSLGAMLCLVVPLLGNVWDFGEGADDRAGQMVEQLQPMQDTSGFFTAFEPSEASEPWLFSLQVFIGITLFTWAVWASRRAK